MRKTEGYLQDEHRTKILSKSSFNCGRMNCLINLYRTYVEIYLYAMSVCKHVDMYVLNVYIYRLKLRLLLHLDVPREFRSMHNN